MVCCGSGNRGIERLRSVKPHLPVPAALLLALLIGAGCKGRLLGLGEESESTDERPLRQLPTTSSAVASASPSAAVDTPPPVDLAPLRGAPCASPPGVLVAVSPERPAVARPLRVLAVGAPAGAQVVVVPPEGAPAFAAIETEERNGPPISQFARVTPQAAGTHRAYVVAGGAPRGCTEIVVDATASPTVFPRARAAWTAEAEWTRETEDLFAAWVEKLFDAPPSESPSFAALHEVTQVEARNFLFDHFALDEDAALPRGLRLDPDCADLPYFLRAYFAWKLRLPFAFSSCTRGVGAVPPRCLSHKSHAAPMEAQIADPVRRMERFLRTTLKDTAHSGTGRTRAEDDATDYYPIELSAKTLRPGTIYADPYGHVLVVAKIVPQTDDAAGVLYAIDGQPDGTVARKRFWEGNFLFSTAEPAMGSPGFKRFRPFSLSGTNVVYAPNAEITRDPRYADFGENQYAGDATAFYDLVESALSPDPLEPKRALLEKIQALQEQVETRVKSVDNGEARFKRDASEIEMPDGAAIFETTGDWESFSTPSRDLRLLIAIDVVRAFPSRVRGRPSRYALPPGTTLDAAVGELEATLAAELDARSVTYTRSDGTPWSLRLSDVVSRARSLEVAYNPNDCVEHRWGAEPGSDEGKTCRRRAGGGQRQKMERMRSVFEKRQRPPRGG